VRGALTVQARLIAQGMDRLRRGLGIEGLDRLGDADRENPSVMERLTHHGVVDPAVARHGMDGQLERCRDPLESGWDVVDQRSHRAGITGMAPGDACRNDKAWRWRRDDPGLAPKWGGAVALALEDGGDSAIVGINDCTVGEALARGQSARWLTDGAMGLQGGVEVCCQARARRLAPWRGALKAWLGGLGPRGHRHAMRPQRCCRLADQAHQDVALAPAWPAKAPHDLREVVVQRLGLARQRGRWRGAWRRDGFDELEDFCCALSSVAASVTRGLPCSAGTVSMTRGAGLTRPSSMAAAA
jgi:hypothetical protein